MATELDTPLSLYLRAVYSLPLPARFYDPKSLKPYVKIGAVEGGTSLISLYEKGESNLSTDDIASAFIVENVKTGGAASQRAALTSVVEALKSYGNELSTRFGIETLYLNYSVAQLEVDRDSLEATFRAQKDYERILSKGIEAANEKISECPVAALSRPEVQQSNLVFTKVTWDADAVNPDQIRSRDIAIQPIVDRNRLTNEDAPDVFTLFRVTGDPVGIPYLGYHTPVADQYRVATTPQLTGGATIKSVAIHPDKDEYTYRVISSSELYSDLRGSSSFLSFMFRGLFCLLDFSHSSLIINRVQKEAEEALTQELQGLLPFLRIEGMTHRRITAKIVSPIGGAMAYHVLFFDAMLNQSEYVGFKEEGDPQLLKPIRTFYLSPIPRVINPLTDEFATVDDIYAVISNRVSANSELVTLDQTKTTHELARGTSYVEFMIYNVADNAMLRFAMAYLSRMVGHYYDVAVPQYSPFITGEFRLPLTATTDMSSDAVYSRTSDIRGIDLISHSYPEVFGHNFTRLCPYYPAVKQQLEAGEVEYRTHDTSETGGKGEWLKYPPDGNIEFYFRCGDVKSHPYPGVIVSKLRNKVKYPLLPCCFRASQFREGSRTEVAYRLGSAKASSVTGTDITISSWGAMAYPPSYNKRLLMSSEKTLHRGRLGRIPEALMSIITSHILPSGTGVCPAFDSQPQDPSDNEDEEDGRRLVRLGLSETNMIHACYLAVDSEYQKLSAGSTADRLSYLQESLAKNLPHSACLYQELQARDATREVLMSSLSSWTTASHYRILEEVLGINLYVIIRITPRENAIEPNRYFFEIPSTRSGAPHMRRHSGERPSVILYRVRRFEGDVIVDSGIELLMHGNRFTAFSALWGTACSAKIAELYNRSAQVLSFGTSPIDPAVYAACLGLNTTDYSATLGMEPESQLIDERGLCRALNYQDFSIVFPGTQPYNLPFSVNLRRALYDPVVRRAFGDSCLTSIVRDGVFYMLGEDPTRYVFIPLEAGDHTLPPDLPKTSYTPLTGLLPSAVDYSVQWRTAYTYLRVILFFLAFLYAFTEPRDPAEFMQRRVVIDETRHAPQAKEVYDFTGLKRIIVLREPTMTEALGTIRRLAPSLLDPSGERVVVTSQKIYDGLEYYVRTVHDQTVATPLTQLRKRRWDLANVIAPVREGGGSATLLLSPPVPGEKQAATLDFGSTRSVRTWFRSLRSGATSGSMIPTSDSRAVVEIIRARTGVILFRHPNTGRVWLIPGITDYLRSTAVVCYLWNTQHRVIELESQAATVAAVDKLNVQSGLRPPRTSRITAMFRQRRSRSSRGSRVIGEEIEDISELKHLIDSENIRINKYVITRDNHIERLLEETPVKPGAESGMVIEVLRSGPDRYTPMLSP